MSERRWQVWVLGWWSDDTPGAWMWKDTDSVKGAHLINVPRWCLKQKWINMHNRTCTYKLFGSLWRRVYMNGIKWKKGVTNIFIIPHEQQPCIQNVEFLKWIRRKGGKLVLVMVNAIHNYQNPMIGRSSWKNGGVQLSILQKYCDRIYSMSPYDAEKLHLPFLNWDVYSLENNKNAVPIVWDIFFVGGLKDRLKVLSRLAKRFQEEGIRAKMHILGTPSGQAGGVLKKYFNSSKGYLPYPEVQQNVRKSNCILELVEAKQTCLTLRTMEALTYNKKLLTNNKYIKDFKYYDPRYIQVFQNVDEIDFDFIKEQTPVDYGYDGEYSPCNIIKKIVKDISKNDRRKIDYGDPIIYTNL